MMKSIMFVIVCVVVILGCLGFLTGAAFGQAVGTSVQPAYGPSYSVPEHPMHAEQHDLRPETSLLGGNGVTVAHGERPLSDFPDDSVPEKPLGTVAREYRHEHQTAAKAEIIWNK